MPSNSIFSSAELFALFRDFDCFRFDLFVLVALRGLTFCFVGRANGNPCQTEAYRSFDFMADSIVVQCA